MPQKQKPKHRPHKPLLKRKIKNSIYFIEIDKKEAASKAAFYYPFDGGVGDGGLGLSVVAAK